MNKVDIVYVVGNPTKCKNNFMLRYSLRSLAKYGKNINRIIVAGYPPDWLNEENIIKVQIEDSIINGVTGKHWNILNCIKEAIKQCNITKPFLYSSDDHFFIQETDFGNYPRYMGTNRCPSRAYLEKTYKNRWYGPYLDMIASTRQLLDENNLPNRMACCHTNTWMDPKYIDDVIKLAYSRKELTPKYGFEPTCLFNAFFERDNPNTKYKKIEDGDKKIIKVSDFETKLNRNTPTFTIHERLDHNNDIELKLFSIYPEKSIYENDNYTKELPKKEEVNLNSNKKIKLAITWIGIGNYNFMFEKFYESFKKHFCVECDRTFFVFTDNPEICNGKDDCIPYKITNPCTDRGWIRFRKFKYLMMAEEKYIDYDYVCYMNGNMLCQQDISFSEITTFNTLYTAINHPKNNPLKAGIRRLHPSTNASFTPTVDIRYKQSGWILANSLEFLRMCNTIEGWRQLDKANGTDKYISMHDEAYYNKYMYLHKDEVLSLEAKIYLCPITWPISGDAKMVQLKKDEHFNKNGEILGEDTKKDLIYSL